MQNTGTVKQGYSEYEQNEMMLTAKSFSFPLTYIHVVNLTDVTNFAYNETKSPVPDTWL